MYSANEYALTNVRTIASEKDTAVSIKYEVFSYLSRLKSEWTS